MGNSSSDSSSCPNSPKAASLPVSPPPPSLSRTKSLLQESQMVAVPQSAYMLKECLRDIGHKKIRKVIFATCPLRGWFVNHWALIFEREDSRFLTV